MFNCDSYTGVTCVDGGCPDALAIFMNDVGIETRLGSFFFEDVVKDC